MCTASSRPPSWSTPACSRRGVRRFERAERFFWSVRCHLHLAAGRAEERLGFDHAAPDRRGDALRRPAGQIGGRALHAILFPAGQGGRRPDRPVPRPARRADGPTRAGASPCRRFMRRPAKLARLHPRPRPAVDSRRRLVLAKEPVRLVELFALAAREGLEIHPQAMRAAARDARLVDQVRDDPHANAFFLDVLTNRERPDVVLRWMNEAGVFGRFVPDFGRVVAQMQFDMYHHYTVDEHSIRAIGLLAAIERGELAEDHPLVDRLVPPDRVAARRSTSRCCCTTSPRAAAATTACLASEVALRLVPALRARCGGDRDGRLAGAAPPAAVGDRLQARPRRSQDDRGFRRLGAKPRAAAPAADADRGRYPRGRAGDLERLEAAAAARPVRRRRGAAAPRPQAARPDGAGQGTPGRSWPPRSAGRRAPSAPTHAACPTATGSPSRPPGRSPMPARSRTPRRASAIPSPASSPADEPQAGATRVSVFAPDRPGLFYRICAGLAAAGASIVDARIHTTRDGMALDNLLVQDSQRQRLCRPAAARAAGQGGRGGAECRGDAGAAGADCRCRAAGPPSRSRRRR